MDTCLLLLHKVVINEPFQGVLVQPERPLAWFWLGPWTLVCSICGFHGGLLALSPTPPPLPSESLQGTLRNLSLSLNNRH